MKLRVIFNPTTNNLLLFIGCPECETMITIEPDNSLYNQFMKLTKQN